MSSASLLSTADTAVPPGLTFSSLSMRRPRLSPAGLAVVVAFHVLVFWLLLKTNVIQLPEQLQVLTVSLIQPVQPVEPKPEIIPEIIPPQPKPVKPRPLPRPRPVPLAVPERAPVEAVAVVPPAPVQAPVVEEPPAPPQPSQPRFDADYLDNPKPPYPPLSRRLGEEGKVMLRVHVGVDGRPIEVRLQGSSGSPRLDQSALSTVRRWKFVPARLGQEAVAAWVVVPIAFILKE